MAAADVRDMLDLPADGQPRPHKKQKVVEKRPEGITRELYALLGERAPPIAINENKYKGRPKWMSKVKVRPWDWTPFTNPARDDDLELGHWQRKRDATNHAPPVENATTDAEGNQSATITAQKSEEAYPFAKFNVKAQLPRRYTLEEYERHLKSDQWTREETDYLMELVQDFDLRWVVIADRYDYSPIAKTEDSSTAVVAANRRRTMEQLKARYYTVAHTMMALELPPSEMSAEEFDLYEKMLKFNPEQEKFRKELANLQMSRSREECDEEEILLNQLKRIVANEHNFIAERKELYARLEAPASTGNTAMYQSSQGLSQLLQALLQADKSKKRRSILGADTATSSPASAQPPSNVPSSVRESRADTPTGPATSTNKKGSAAAAAASNANQPTAKILSPAEEVKYGVTHHDRLASGVQFRNEKAIKLTQAKSNIQSQKLAAALTELEIPPRLVMPTDKVCKEFEKLIQSVNLLLETRKFAEKVENEIRVLEATKEERERKEKEVTQDQRKPAEVKTEEVAGPEGVGDVAATDDAAATSQPTGEENGVQEGGQGGPSGPSEPPQDATENAGGGAKEQPTHKEQSTHKRSASVLSGVSDKSAKRQRK